MAVLPSDSCKGRSEELGRAQSFVHGTTFADVDATCSESNMALYFGCLLGILDWIAVRTVVGHVVTG